MVDQYMKDNLTKRGMKLVLAGYKELVQYSEIVSIKLFRFLLANCPEDKCIIHHFFSLFPEPDRLICNSVEM